MNSFHKKACLISLVSLIALNIVFSDIRLPSVISDNMVLQRNEVVTIWGWADPGETVHLKADWQWFFGSSVAADKDGKWQIDLRTPGDKSPHKIKIKGKNTITLENVLLGEVWLCSGQSNMYWPVERSDNAEQETGSADYPKIRLIQAPLISKPEPQNDIDVTWQKCSPDSAAGFSAAAYYFGRELHKKLGVPIGLIHASWGGSSAEAWFRRSYIEQIPELSSLVKTWQGWLDNPSEFENLYEKRLENWRKQCEKAEAEGKEKPGRPGQPVQLRSNQKLSYLYNGMIAPFTNYTIRGVIWYQGESNHGRAYQYRTVFPALIKNWREDFKNSDMPFYFVQIAPWQYGNLTAASELREAQLMTFRALENTGIVVTADIGNMKNIHPTNKQDVGKRLALWALNGTYGRTDLVPSGPLYREMKIEGNIIRLYFDYTGSGLRAEGKLTHFTIAGPDGAFKPADAKIDGDTVIVYNDQIKNPVAVRFAWGQCDKPNLFNKEGLPASPFRTDDFECVTKQKSL